MGLPPLLRSRVSLSALGCGGCHGRPLPLPPRWLLLPCVPGIVWVGGLRQRGQGREQWGGRGLRVRESPLARGAGPPDSPGATSVLQARKHTESVGLTANSIICEPGSFPQPAC